MEGTNSLHFPEGRSHQESGSSQAAPMRIELPSFPISSAVRTHSGGVPSSANVAGIGMHSYAAAAGEVPSENQQHPAGNQPSVNGQVFAGSAQGSLLNADAADVDEETDSDVNVAAQMQPVTVSVQPKPTFAEPALPPRPPSGGPPRGGRGGAISLKMLIDEGLMLPGKDVLTVEYKGDTYTADLRADGAIVATLRGKQEEFTSPSSFSVNVKRLKNPTRKADDGWKSVKYEGRFLEQYKHELARRVLGGEGEGPLPPLEPRAAKRARIGDSSGAMLPLSFGQPGSNATTIADRPRRARRAPPRFAAIGVDDEHALQPLEAFGDGEQPFTVRVAPVAAAMMDFHAHLCMSEVIGILAGHWNAETRHLCVLRAFPVRELATEDDAINVEMDPEDQVARMGEAHKAGMKIVGWYHSHPTFPAKPSTIDIYNQVLQQYGHREEEHVVESEPSKQPDQHATDIPQTTLPAGKPQTVTVNEPYVAAIVSPYDRRLSSKLSALTWFYVDHAPEAVPTEGQRPDEVGCIAKELMVETMPIADKDKVDDLTKLQKNMEQLAKRYAEMPERANLEGAWHDGSLGIDKLAESVASRLPAEVYGVKKIENFALKLGFSTRAVWNVYGTETGGDNEGDVEVSEDEPISDDEADTI